MSAFAEKIRKEIFLMYFPRFFLKIVKENFRIWNSFCVSKFQAEKSDFRFLVLLFKFDRSTEFCTFIFQAPKSTFPF